jgi:hypothetical protein
MLRASTPSVRMVALFAGLLALLAATIAFPGGVRALPATATVVPISGDVFDPDGPTPDTPVGTFKGKLVNPTVSYNETSKELEVAGRVLGTVTQGDTTKKVDQRFSGVPAQVLTSGASATDVTAQQRSCEILDLDIGAAGRGIVLDLLGLVIDLRPVHLNIIAVPGAGKLLGNLLCAIVGLLDPDTDGVVNTANADLAKFLNGLLRRLF